jgi:hypothetical protein
VREERRISYHIRQIKLSVRKLLSRNFSNSRLYSSRLTLLGLLHLNFELSLGQLSLGLQAHDSTAPLSLEVFIELSLEVVLQALELGLVLLVHGGKGAHSGGLLVGEGAQSSLALDNGEGDIHLLAKSGKPDNQLDGVNVVGDDDQLGLLLLNEGGNVLQAVLEHGRGRAGPGGGGLTSSGGLGGGLEADVLGGISLGLVLHQQLEQLGSLVLVQGSVELVQSRGHLQSLKKDLQ